MPYDLTKLAPWCVALTWAYVATAMFSLAHTVFELGLGYDLIDPSYDLDPDGSYAQSVYWAILGFALFVYTVNGIWIYRAATNAQAIDPIPMAVTPGWSVGWYFIPLANLWMPFRAMRETWASSVGTGWPMGSPMVLKVWWAGWVVSSIGNSVVNHLGRTGTTYDDYITLQWFYLPVHASDAIAGAAFAIIIRRISDAFADKRGPAEIFS